MVSNREDVLNKVVLIKNFTTKYSKQLRVSQEIKKVKNKEPKKGTNGRRK